MADAAAMVAGSSSLPAVVRVLMGSGLISIMHRHDLAFRMIDMVKRVRRKVAATMVKALRQARPRRSATSSGA
jgi:hypothetical protein